MPEINPFFINSCLCIDETDISSCDNFLNSVAFNIGNSYPSWALIKQLKGGLVRPHHIQNIWKYDFSQQDKDIDIINNECSHVFLILQDQIRIAESYGLQLPYKNIINFIKKLNKPVIVAGLGANSFTGYDAHFHEKLNPELIEFLKIIADHCLTIGIRGHYTEEILSKLGINNTRVIGCPSYYEMGRNRFLEKKEYSKNLKILLSSTVFSELSSKYNEILQDEVELIKTIAFDNMDFSKLSIFNLESLISKRFATFSNIENWKSYVAQYDFLFGLRVHGAILAANSGTCPLIMNGDSRAREMSEFLKIPYHPEFLHSNNVEEMYEACDCSELNKVYPALYDNFVDFLGENNLKPYKKGESPITDYIEQPTLNLYTNENQPLAIKKYLSFRKLSEKLEIFLITYNRKEHLQNTFNQIFAPESPIKDLEITILDNKSTDGSSELIEEYRKSFPNIKHVIHNRNIGGNANIARAFEMASKKYFWILCDDDEYNWEHWDEVENALEQDYDAVVVSNYVNPEKNVAQLAKQLTFVPAGIYKSENLTYTVMVNAEYNISNMFPQMANVCNLINENKKFYICKNWTVNMVPHGGEETYTRGLSSDIHPYMAEMLWAVGFVNSLQMIKDKKTRNFMLKESSVNNYSWAKDVRVFFELNNYLSHNSIKNICDYFCSCINEIGLKQKLLFITILFSYSFEKVVLIYKLDGNLMIKILNKFKTKLWDYRWFRFYGTESGIYFQCLKKIKMKLWDYRWFRFYRGERGVYFQFLKKIKMKILPLKEKKSNYETI